MSLTQISDVIVPEVFLGYVNKESELKSRLVTSGALVIDESINNELLSSGGVLLNLPSFQDLANDEDNVSSDEALGGNDSTPKKIITSNETVPRLSRNQSWSSSVLAGSLAGADPMRAIGDRAANYRRWRLQAAFIATITGVFADNAAAPGGTEHEQNDLTHDVSGASYVAGTTDFSAEACLDAFLTSGDSSDALNMVMVHSVVYNRMQKNNLIEFIPDSESRVNIPTFLGRTVIVDDSLPADSGVYESWLFGSGAVRLGVSSPKNPVAVERDEKAGNGGGAETLYNRWEWAIHPTGHKYLGTTDKGGPTNAATSDNLANLASWERVYPERKQIKVARLITRES